jgi:hypothetical protein
MDNIEVRVKGHIDITWSDWFEGLTVTHTTEGETVLRGTVADQSTLFGLLNRLSGLSLHLVSVSSQHTTPGKQREVMDIEEGLSKRT